MVVALFVLGVALTGIVRSLGYGVGVAGAAHRTMAARQLATGLAAELPLERADALAAAAGAGPERIDVEEVGFDCTRSIDAWEEGERAWFWIEVECDLAGEAGGAGWRPGRAALLVAR